MFAMSIIENVEQMVEPRRHWCIGCCNVTDPDRRRVMAWTDIPEGFDETLGQRLRDWRNERADELGISPFMGGRQVISNRIIDEVVRLLPPTEAALQGIKGIGDRKMEQFSGAILEIVNSHIAEAEISREHVVDYYLVCYDCLSYWPPSREQFAILGTGPFHIVDKTGSNRSSEFEFH